MANERTFLAWVRTGIALIGFGFVIAKFALFLEVIRSSKLIPYGSVIYGEVMIFLGGAAIVYGLYTYIEAELSLDKGTYRPRKVENTIFALTVLLVSIALALLLV
ncbi:YidH family protein [Sulfodiicoccus acidiphilus]|nr:DUF202 domain-containing protein [Sulfodiicoccus acidiphilus]